ncbi:acyl-CoA dehydrogenase family protein [Pseudomonas putida]
MKNYSAPLQDYSFLLKHVVNYTENVTTLPGLEDNTLDLVEAVIQEAAKFAENILEPLNRTGDEQACHWSDGKVYTPSGFKAAFAQYHAAGWQGIAADPEHGGQGLPGVIALIVREIFNAANPSFGTYFGLSQGAYHAIAAHGSDTLKQTYLPSLAQGRWTGTMCLTEPQCGSDLSLIKTKASPAEDESYRITGTKIFVTGGDQDMAQNIIHLVLARLPDAPPGIKGLSLFVVPKLLQSNEGEWIIPNDVVCTGIEHKMGLRASATASLAFEGATGWLIGEAHQGMRAMFTMMNSSRLGVSVQAVGLAEAARQYATRYAQERRQGRAPNGADNEPVSIINHPDVRRNLLTVKAFVEGARALWMWSGVCLDRRNRHPDFVMRQSNDDLLALLTPVLKSFLSDQSFLATNAAMQVFGGHGYIRETGIEQFVRDGRIISLYEGTNGIQALDLINRKIKLNDGQAIHEFLTLVEQEAHALEASHSTYANPLNNAINNLRHATEYFSSDNAEDIYQKSGAAHNYLQLFGLVAMGFAWAKIVNAASALLENEAHPQATHKLTTAAFFFTRVLPEQIHHYHMLFASSTSLMALDNEAF